MTFKYISAKVTYDGGLVNALFNVPQPKCVIHGGTADGLVVHPADGGHTVRVAFEGQLRNLQEIYEDNNNGLRSTP